MPSVLRASKTFSKPPYSTACVLRFVSHHTAGCFACHHLDTLPAFGATADASVGEVADIEEMIKVAPATTMAGLAVKLRVLAAWATLHGERPEEEIEWDDARDPRRY
jgi:hypothetical protein